MKKLYEINEYVDTETTQSTGIQFDTMLEAFNYAKKAEFKGNIVNTKTREIVCEFSNKNLTLI